MRTAVKASRLALPGFVIPFPYIYQQAMLLGTGYSLMASAKSILFITLAVLLISCAGYPAKGKARYAPIGLGIALALLLFGPLISGVAAVAAVALKTTAKFSKFKFPKDA